MDLETPKSHRNARDMLDRAHDVSRDMEGFTQSLYAQAFPNPSFTASEGAISLVRALACSLSGQALQAVHTNLFGENETYIETGFSENYAYSHSLLSFLYARIIEWHYCETIGEESASHPEISDDLQRRITSDDDDISTYAMGQLVAQSRFISAIKDFSYPLSELPAELAHELIWAAARDIEKNGQADNTSMAKAARKTLSAHNESDSRLRMLQEHVNASLRPKHRCNAAALGKFGVSHFFAMLSEKTGLLLEQTLILSSAQDRAAFAILLRAAKCPVKDIAKIIKLLELPGQYQDIPSVMDIKISASDARNIVAQWTPYARRDARW